MRESALRSWQGGRLAASITYIDHRKPLLNPAVVPDVSVSAADSRRCGKAVEKFVFCLFLRFPLSETPSLDQARLRSSVNGSETFLRSVRLVRQERIVICMLTSLPHGYHRLFPSAQLLACYTERRGSPSTCTMYQFTSAHHGKLESLGACLVRYMSFLPQTAPIHRTPYKFCTYLGLTVFSFC